MRRFILLLLLCSAAVCRAGSGFGDIQVSLPFTNYSTAQGLISNDCFMVQQDGDGYIWIGTGMGICRYDGRTFRHFPAPGVWPFRSARWAVNRNGTVYFGLDEWGAVSCRGDSVRFIPLPNNHIWTIYGFGMANDTTFLFSENSQGILRMWPHSLRRLFNPEREDADFIFTNPMSDRRGNLWWAANKERVSLFLMVMRCCVCSKTTPEGFMWALPTAFIIIRLSPPPGLFQQRPASF